MHKLLIGIGNELRADDGAGAVIVRRLEQYALPDVQTEIITQLTPEWLERIAKARFTVLVDVRVASPEDDGMVHIEALTATASGASSGHALNIAELVALGERIYGKLLDVRICSVPAFDFTLGHPLSAKCSECIDPAVNAVLSLLTENTG